MLTKNQIHAIVRLRPNCDFSVIGNDLNQLIWINPEDTKTPTLKEIDAEIEAESQREILRANEKTALLAKLGITADEAALLLS